MGNDRCYIDNENECVDRVICTKDPVPVCAEYEERTECVKEELVCLEAETECTKYYDRCIDDSVECV